MSRASGLAARWPAVAAPAVPNPGSGTAPPGAEKFLLVLGWGAWLVTIGCVAGILLVAGRMAVQHRRGQGGGEAGAELAWVLAACVLGAAAGPLVSALR